MGAGDAKLAENAELQGSREHAGGESRELGWAPHDLEAAIVAPLQPGAYTAIVSGESGGGVALVEVYDLTPTQGRIANISTRGRVSTGDNVMIAGFIVNGPESKRLLLRGIGPSLRPTLPSALGDTTLEMHNANGTLMISNTGWTNSADAGAEVHFSGLAPTSNAESAILREVVPGNFTVILKSPSNASGIGLVEVYDVAP